MKSDNLVWRRWLFGAAAIAMAIGLWRTLIAQDRSLFGIEALPIWVFLPILIAAVFNLMLYLVGFTQWWTDQGSDEYNHAKSLSRVALVMPVFHEDVERIRHGILATWRSCAKHGLSSRADFFVLSDSTDPRIQTQEQEMIGELGAEFHDKGAESGRVFLIRRSDRSNYKAGNIMNFLEKQGSGYDYMLVLDADSVMLGGSVKRLIDRMDASPRTAILQSLMLPIRSVAPFSKAMQYGIARSLPLFTRGVYWFFEKDSVYWGHNALVRVEPFRRHCNLPQLPGKPPLGGTILSQDIVEAAFLGRAGWRVDWDVDSRGSFDEMPANLLTYGTRDRRWCHGNFQHSRFLFSPGIRFGHRLLFANGIFSYCAGPALLTLIAIGLSRACQNGLDGLTANPMLLAASVGLFWFLMLTPRFLALVRTFVERRRRHTKEGLGSTVLEEVRSTALELGMTLLTGPLLFYLHGQFILEILLGRTVSWKNQPRDPRLSVGWESATRVFWPTTVMGVIALCLSIQIGWQAALLLAPINLSWILSIPTAVWTSRPGIGEALIRRGFFPDLLSPEERDVVASLEEWERPGRKGINGTLPTQEARSFASQEDYAVK